MLVLPWSLLLTFAPIINSEPTKKGMPALNDVPIRKARQDPMHANERHKLQAACPDYSAYSKYGSQ